MQDPTDLITVGDPFKLPLSLVDATGPISFAGKQLACRLTNAQLGFSTDLSFVVDPDDDELGCLEKADTSAWPIDVHLEGDIKLIDTDGQLHSCAFIIKTRKGITPS